MGIPVHLAVAADVFDVFFFFFFFFFVLSLFPRDVLDEIWDLIESESEFFFYLFLSCSSLGRLSIMLDRAVV